MVMDEFALKAEAFRREKDAHYLVSEASPFNDEEKAGFRGLKYFPYDGKYRVIAHFAAYENPEQAWMDTSKGLKQEFKRVGYFEFELEGRKLRLQAYKIPLGPHGDEYFVPFKDATCGAESYEKGRYLTIKEGARIRGDEFLLDFNYAYNPYCAYVDRHMCPFPLPENVLDIAIRAGEKKYREDKVQDTQNAQNP